MSANPPPYEAATAPPKPQQRPRPLLHTPPLNYLRNHRTILASASPRRAFLLSTLGLHPEIRPSTFAEDLDKSSLSPYEYVLQTAKSKALDVYESALREGRGVFTTKNGFNSRLKKAKWEGGSADDVESQTADDEEPETNTAKKDAETGDPECIIAADTIIVSHDGAVLEKPRNEAHHIAMLRSLRDSGSARGLITPGLGRAKPKDTPSNGNPAQSLDEKKPLDEKTVPTNQQTAYDLTALQTTIAEADSLLGPGVRGESTASFLNEPTPKPHNPSQIGSTATPATHKGWHRVLTAIVVLMPLPSARDPGYTIQTHVEETGVKFDPNISDSFILAYVRCREGADKAGGYGIQGMGALLVEKIDGSVDNVIGLPLRALLGLVEKGMRDVEEDEGEDGEDVLASMEERGLLVD